MGTVCDAVLVSVLQTPIFLSRRGGRFIARYNIMFFFRGVAIVRRGRVGQISFRTDKFYVLHGGIIVYLFIHTFRFLFSRRPTDLEMDCSAFLGRRIPRRPSHYTLGIIIYNVHLYHGVTCLVFTIFFFFIVNTLRTRVDLQRLCRYIYRYYYYLYVFWPQFGSYIIYNIRV